MSAGDADLILSGGKVLTVDGAFSQTEAVAIRGNRILAVGAADDVRALAGRGTRTVDLAGRTAMPGVNDAHLHLAMWAISRPPYQLDLRPGAGGCLADIVAAVERQARSVTAGDWIVGRGWTAEHIREFAGGARTPSRHDLDAVSAHTPVLLWHRSEHAAWVNSRALELAGIRATTSDPVGGIERNPSTGEPTGQLTEGAVDLVADHVPEPTEATWEEAILAGMAELNRRGVTSVTDPMVEPPLVSRYTRLHNDRKLSLRLGMLLHWTRMGPANRLATLEEAIRYTGSLSGIGDDWFRVAGVKLFADGIPPLRTSWMYRPFAPGGCGGLVVAGDDDEAKLAELGAMIRFLHRQRFRIGVHATGDRACDAVAEAYMRALDEDPWPGSRHHLIHASLLRPGTARRLAGYDVTISGNALIKWQATDALAEIFDEDTNAYHVPVRSLLDAGLHVADASDAPISEPDWRQAVETLVLREARGSGRVSGPAERISRADAIRAWTYEGAYQDRLEHTKGSIEPGKLADLVVLGEDPLSVEPHRLHDLPVDMTVLDGRIVHEA